MFEPGLTVDIVRRQVALSGIVGSFFLALLAFMC